LIAALGGRDILSLAVGALEVALALIVLRQLVRFGRAFPWLGALMLFFVLRGLDRLYLGIVDREEPFVVGLLSDGLLLAVVILLALGLEKTIRALRVAQEDAQHRQLEYERALADYRRLARHRLANPLTTILGSVAVLRELPELDQGTRAQILDNIREEARRLERVALEPEAQRDEERSLRPQPDVRRE
jgi:signal transduction histidine kinase